VTTKAWLVGHQFDVDHLAQLLSTGDVKVMRDGDRYYLTSPEIDNPTPETKKHEVAERLINYVNGLGRVTHSNFRPVTLTRIYDDEAGTTVVPVPAHLELRAATFSAVGVVTDPSGTVVPAPPSPWPDYLALAATDSDVAEALEIMGGAESLGWDDLYKVFEIIREAVRPDTIITLGWTSAADLDSFKESANRQDVSGDGARHARRPGRPQHRAMPLGEGRSFVSSLVTKWLGMLAGNG
jgi:hypothetical protein